MMQAFVLLRQSALTNEDKKRVLTMAGGSMDLTQIEKSMRTLSTKVLFSAGEPKRKIYPANLVEQDEVSTNQAEEEGIFQSTYHVSVDEEDILTAEHIEVMANQGDEDALTVQQFERDFEDMMQEIPDLQNALVTYQEARQRISDRRKSRGFWPTKGKQKGSFKGSRKGQSKSGKDELLAKISRTHCKICGALGHWKAECPQRRDGPREQANVVVPENDIAQNEDLPQVIFEQISEDQVLVSEVCLTVHSVPALTKGCIRPQAKQEALKFWSNKVHKYKWGKGVSSTMTHMLHRKPSKRAIHRRKGTNEAIQAIDVADCLTSRVHQSKLQSSGLAILDTGASRSVIGEEHLSAVLQKLPPEVRQSVRECPSKVGFRFGNNQVSYSFKQLQIPLCHGRQRIWLLIEVVPKATPFLLSIKTMKSLGASIDLSANTCYLRTLNKSLPLKVNQNGLFVIDMADLCKKSDEPIESALLASSALIEKPPGLSTVCARAEHADSSASSGGPSSGVRGNHDLIAHPPHDDLQHDHGNSAGRECVRSRCRSDQSADLGSQVTEGEDCRTWKHHLQPVPEPQDQIHGTATSEPYQSCWDGFVGVGRNGGRRKKPGYATASLPVQNINLHGLGPSISPSTTSVTPMTPPRNPVAAGKVSKIAGSPICGAPSGQAASAAAGVNDQNALALTNAALEQWGAKLITWGKKHTGKTFRQTYEGDPGYVRWCQARSGSLHEDIADFLNYAITRQRLQTMANQVNNM